MVIDTVEVIFKINGLIIPYLVKVAEHLSHDVILGADFLAYTKAKVDCYTNTLDIYEGLVRVPMVRSNDNIAYTTSAVKIPALSEAIFPVYLKHKTERNFLLEDGPAPCKTIAVARTLVNYKQPCCRVLNPSCNVIKLRPHTPIAVASTVQTTTEIIAQPPPKQELPSLAEMRAAIEEKGVSLKDTILTGLDEEKLVEQLYLNRDLAAMTLADLPGCSIMFHSIDTGSAEPIQKKSYRMSVEEKKEISRQTKEMLEAGIITPSSSPWSFPVVLTRKSDGSMRFCVDYRGLNAVTRLVSTNLPTIDEIIDWVAENKNELKSDSQQKDGNNKNGGLIYTTLDLHSGYFQMMLDPETSEKTTFDAPDGRYKFTRLPQGIALSSVQFTIAMRKVLAGLNPASTLIYLDDVMIVATSPEQMRDRLQQVFDRFRAAKLRIKAKKCAWSVNKVNYLGFVFHSDGISADDRKIALVKNFPTPTTPRKVKSFMGLLSYFRRFIKNFSQIAEPLRELLKGG